MVEMELGRWSKVKINFAFHLIHNDSTRHYISNVYTAVFGGRAFFFVGGSHVSAYR